VLGARARTSRVAATVSGHAHVRRSSAPEDADRIALDLIEQRIDPRRRAKQRVALPTSCVSVVVERPEPSRTRVPKPRDRHTGPLRSAVLSPRRSAFDDRHGLPALLELDSHLVAGMVGNALGAELADSGNVRLGKHTGIVNRASAGRAPRTSACDRATVRATGSPPFAAGLSAICRHDDRHMPESESPSAAVCGSLGSVP